MRRILMLLVFVVCAACACGQAVRQRLILKDGSYQVVTSYQVVGDRVRYRSAERGDEVEEIPYALVDWPATEAWKKTHAPGAGNEDRPDSSEAQQDAAAVDADARAQQADDASRRPTVAPGLRLPDASGVWGLDIFRGMPEVVRMEQASGDLNRATGHSVHKVPLPVAGERGAARTILRLSGYKAKVQFHVAQPVFYVGLDASAPEEAPAGALTVDTHGAAAAAREKGSASSPDSRYIAVRAVPGREIRVVSGTELAEVLRGGEDVTQMRTEVLPGKHWMKLTAQSPLAFGEYVLVELPAAGEMNVDGWDFGVEPRAPENKGAFQPLESRDEQP